MTRNVVVTGIGMTTPIGGDAASTWAAALAAQVRRSQKFFPMAAKKSSAKLCQIHTRVKKVF
jgi:3-oxoacyl-(acyl-carrier-protein) synthase